MKYNYIAIVGLILFLAGTLQASEQRGALVLNKIPIYEFDDARNLGCTGLYDVNYGRDVADMREFRNFLCMGRYEMTLRGKKGRTVTLFAQFDFGKKGGFLVVRKTDDKKIWIPDLENLPSGQWTTVSANNQTGGYEAFYREASGFDQNISSVKWDKWWQDKTPE